jgi:exosortase
LRGDGPSISIPGVTGTEGSQRPPISAWINLAALAILACALVVHLWPEWTQDPDLSHAFLMPAICVVLLYMGRRPGGADALAPRTAALLAGTLGCAALAGLLVAGLLAATVDWASQVVDFTLAGSFALLGCGAVAAFADRRVGWIRFNWTSLAAAALWTLCSPLPPGTYSRLTVGLQLWVSDGVVRALEILGIAAHQQGNIIELARGTVGIEEACSGVRSLVSCVFTGLLLSAALIRRPWARLAVIALSAPLALAMNFIRSLLLTLLVNGGVRVEGAWHDATGYAVLVVTAALLFGVAVAVDGGAPGQKAAPAPEPAGDSGAAPAVSAQAVLGGILALAAAVLVFFAASTYRPPERVGPAPDLLAMLPSSAPGWSVMPAPDLYRFAGTLRTDHLAQRTYLRNGAHGFEQVTLYLAYWSAGQASVGAVGSHTPDACWPGAGWVAKAVTERMVSLDLGPERLPPAQNRFFTSSDYSQHVWFWQLYGGRVINVGSTRSVPALIRIALRFGFRRGSEQAFVRVSSNRPWEEIANEPFIAEFFGHARQLGLY